MKRPRIFQLTVLAGTVLTTGVLLADGDEEYETRKMLPPVSSARWQAECGTCHMAYPPGLLPERSWRRLMAGLDEHFGENASLDPQPAQEITEFLVANSADRSENRRSRSIAQSVPRNAAPLRITETRFFRKEHREINLQVWKRKAVGSPANCPACHKSADRGDFSERNVAVPR